MRANSVLLGVQVLLVSVAAVLQPRRPAPRDYGAFDYFVLEHNPDSSASRHDAVGALGLEFVEQVGELKDHWLARAPKARATNVPRALAALRADAISHAHPTVRRTAARVADSIRSLELQAPRLRAKRALSSGTSNAQSLSPAAATAQRLQIRDPLFFQQWHIVNDFNPANSVNVTGVWESGITGKGVTVAMVDDGLDYNSKDLAANFDAEGSYDFNDHESLPGPKLFDDTHGTRCAGEIAAVRNDVCGVGMAYDAKIAGLRILSHPITDADEATALNYGYQSTAIYSCSWGPSDDGRSVGAPSTVIEKAMVQGINAGRGGKGSIFVFASGNGAAVGDQCNFDCYTNSVFTVTVAAIDYTNARPSYSEACAANMIATYSSGHGRAFALALEARPELTWRDIQHLCVRTAVQVNPTDPDWERTASGRAYSYKYGYGSLDTWALVEAARTWKLVGPQAWLQMPVVTLADASMEDGVLRGGEPLVLGGISHTMRITSDLVADANLYHLEHVTVRVWIRHTRRGAVSVELVSPAGIRSVLASPRERDTATEGLAGWQFMTLKHWDESPVGPWTIKISDAQSDNMEESGAFMGWSMTLWGSARDPALAVPWAVPDPARLHVAFTAPSLNVTSATATSTTSAVTLDYSISAEPSFSVTVAPSHTTSTIATLTPSHWNAGWITLLMATFVFLLLGASGCVLLFWRRWRASSHKYTSIASHHAPVMAVVDGESVLHVVGEDSDWSDNEDNDDASLLQSRTG
ncbi:subtilisin-like protein [Exidia glandulosa HHB12029]|uniref:Subtilisin-like protein n=1 Tax=Exidia glandulosa HHB12029 TaxID=1314781 RepID=A0A165EPB6_EXIGL|nr:subtilisin-like protein [Exidia glandulosa HHB12029]